MKIVHRGLRRLYERGDARQLDSRLVPRLRRILLMLDEAAEPHHMNLPGLRLHPLKGNRAGQWSVSVSGNWRIVFRFADGDVVDVDLVDYH
ncbi:MAG: type II toxin-antitoxin system RelE/ParE family toxin [Rhodospirillales bacterium]|nr:type II toxin-antitoxin system RelE/ParE family toxin [Rhodospirillales bacterium]MDE0377943.1 type II toxin-antitoxin system RelE/ParE family toxin [Rhodospirillales bacterium]